MTYSRRQLYALGETFGSCATHRGVGGKIIYGGGSDAPPSTVEPTTRVTEYGPDMNSFNRSSTNEIPRYLTDASQDLVARGQALSSRPYEAYTGARVAEFTPDMETAFGRMRNQQIAPQIGEATGLAGLAGQRAMQVGSGLGTYDPYEMGGFNAERAQQYMNPYMQNVVDVERRKAQEAANRQSAVLSGQAARQGAFGGSGAALQQRALTRDTAQQLGDIQTQGMGRAYDQGLARFGAEEAMRERSREYGADYRLKGEQLSLDGIRTALSSANVLSGLGQQQFGQEMDITKGLGMAGDVQRQRQQALLDVGYGDYLTEQKYPYEQLAFQQGLVAGVPYSTTQRSAGQDISQRGKTVEQTMKTTEKAPEMAAGGVVKSYAAGGIASLNQPQMASAASGMSDQQLRQTQGLPSITQLAQMTLQAEAQQRAQMRQVAQAQMAQQPQGTVANEEMARIAAMEQGIGGLDVPNLENLGDEYTAAGGGIVAFQPGGQVGSPNAYGLPAISNSLIPQAAQDLMAQQRHLAQDVSEQERLAAEENLAAVRRDQAALGDYTKNQEDRLQTREQRLEGADAGALQSSVLDFGLRLLSTKGKANKAAALAEAGFGTLKGHRDALDRIEKEKKDIDDARNRLDELRYSKKKTDLGAIRDAEKNLATAKVNGTKALGTLIGADAKTVIDAYASQETRKATYASANKPTDQRNYVNDYVQAARAQGDTTTPDSVLRTKGAQEYLSTVGMSGVRAGIAGQTADVNELKASAQVLDAAQEYVDKQIGYGGTQRKKFRDLQTQDKIDETNTAQEFANQLRQGYIDRLPSGRGTMPPPAGGAPQVMRFDAQGNLIQ
jgi:hypothetical protein